MDYQCQSGMVKGIMKPTKHPFVTRTLTCVLIAAGLFQVSLSSHAESITPEEAHSIGVDAYLYFYPLVTMDITRKQLTNVERAEGISAPMNTFANIPAYPTADMRVVVRPNFDTLYSSGWLDLTKEPVVASVPDTGGRYYLFPMLDMWTDVFASPGWRTTGTQAANFLVTPPGWTGSVPDGMQQIKAPTPYVWIIGRTKTDGPPDYDAVRKIQAGYKITPLSRWGKTAEAVTAEVDPSVDMKTPPKIQVDTMSADKYFTYAAEVMKVNPPHITDEPIVARMKRIGIEVGQSFDFGKLDPGCAKRRSASTPADAQALMKWKVPTLARVVNYWSMNTDTMGVVRQLLSKARHCHPNGSLYALPEDAIYPINLGDETGRSLLRRKQYTSFTSTKASCRRSAGFGRLRSTTLRAFK